MADEPSFRAAHCRAARALLDLTQANLADAANVGRMTVKRFEGGGTVRPAQAAAMRLALEAKGVAFLDDDLEIGGRATSIGVVMYVSLPGVD